MCVCDLAVLLGVTKSAVSHQLKALRICILVYFSKEWLFVFFSLDDELVKESIDMVFDHLKG